MGRHPVPALGGNTPREAMRTPAGRRQGRELVDGIGDWTSGKPEHEPLVDVTDQAGFGLSRLTAGEQLGGATPATLAQLVSN
jgi:hypothetical protein